MKEICVQHWMLHLHVTFTCFSGTEQICMWLTMSHCVTVLFDHVALCNLKHEATLLHAAHVFSSAPC